MRNQRIRQLGCHFTAVWEFHVSSGKKRAFEKAYGPEGDWAKLFGRAEGYIRTELIRDRETPLRYVTLDFWTSRLAYQKFKKQNLAEYKALDKKCNSLTESERLIGEFEKFVPPNLRQVAAAASKADFLLKHTIRPAKVADVPAIVALEREAASAAHWSEEAYRDIFKPGAPERIALLNEHEDGSLRGFIVARTNGQDCVLENIVVANSARRQGRGFRLLQALIAEVRRQGAARIFLEVRLSNAAARMLYEKCGFELAGRRKSYYGNPVEDALSFTLTL